jgi:hypothetical protein
MSALSGLVVALCVGCGEPAPRDAEPAEVPAPHAPAGGAADPLVAAVADDARHLSDDAPQDAELAACVAQLAIELPGAVADLLDDLGYRDALADACASQRAVSAGDPAACDDLSATALRAGCRRRLAVRHGSPDACPHLLDRGREPVCLAWAARAPARCAAAWGTQAFVCRAPFEANPELCRELGVERAPCEAAVARVAPLLEPREPRALPHVEGALVARFVSDVGAARGSATPAAGAPTAAAAPGAPTAAGARRLDQPVELDLEHGVYVSREGCLATLQLAPERRTLAHRERLQLTPFLVGLGPLRDAPLRDQERPAAALRVGVLPVVGAPAVLAPPTEGPGGAGRRAPATVGPAPEVTGAVRVRSLQPRRGGAVVLEVDVRVPAEGGAYELRGELHTYVRDIDPLGECQAEPGLL